MVEKRTCDFSGDEIEPGTGTMYVKNDGTVLHFKDSKAEKNYFLGREARDLEWTAEGRRSGAGAVERESEPDSDETPAGDEPAASTEEEPDEGAAESDEEEAAGTADESAEDESDEDESDEDESDETDAESADETEEDDEE